MSIIPAALATAVAQGTVQPFYAVEFGFDVRSGFDVNGEHFGGTYMAEGDDRVSMFVDRIRAERAEPAAILECGCLEGGHTGVIAGAFPAAAGPGQKQQEPGGGESDQLHIFRVRGQIAVPAHCSRNYKFI